MNVLIAGSTGLVGSFALKMLLADERIDRVIVLSRRPLDFSHKKIILLTCEFDHLESLDLAIHGVDHIDAALCALGTTIKKAKSKEAFSVVDHHHVIRFAKFALKYGAKNFGVISALGANPEASVFYNRIKGDMEEELKGLGIPHLSIIRPSLIIGEREKITGDKRMAEKLFIKCSPLLNATLQGPLKKYRGVEAHKVATHLVQSLWNKTSGTTIIENSQMLNI